MIVVALHASFLRKRHTTIHNRPNKQRRLVCGLFFANDSLLFGHMREKHSDKLFVKADAPPAEPVVDKVEDRPKKSSSSSSSSKSSSSKSKSSSSKSSSASKSNTRSRKYSAPVPVLPTKTLAELSEESSSSEAQAVSHGNELSTSSISSSSASTGGSSLNSSTKKKSRSSTVRSIRSRDGASSLNHVGCTCSRSIIGRKIFIAEHIEQIDADKLTRWQEEDKRSAGHWDEGGRRRC